MSDNLPIELIPPALSGPDAPNFPPISAGVVLDFALIESLDLTNHAEQGRAAAEAAQVIASAEARAAKLIAAAVADAEEQVSEVRPLAEAEAEKVLQEARDEASELVAAARQRAAEIIEEVEQSSKVAEDRAAAAVDDARSRAAETLQAANEEAEELTKTLALDRDLVKQRLGDLEGRETATAQALTQAEATLANAKAEAERLTTEAGESVDRMMRSGKAVAAAEREAYTSEHEAVGALQAQHVTAIRDLTDRYEAKVSNQNIENLELRAEIEGLRFQVGRLETSTAGPSPMSPPPEQEPVTDEDESRSVELDKGESDGATLYSVLDDDSFASQWLVPEDEPSERPVALSNRYPAEEISDDSENEESTPTPLGSKLGSATGLAPNARLVEGLEASAFRAQDDPGKKRRKRKR